MSNSEFAFRATVGIVGGGPAGLMTAMELGRKGVSCVVFEREAGGRFANLVIMTTQMTDSRI